MAPHKVINISGLNPVDDPEYRYKMPAVYGKIEGRGNGIKTVIPNITDVALALHRAPGEVNKFFGCELGAQTTYSTDTDRAVVNGAHTDVVLQQMIHRYIEKFVICPQCGLPETDYKIKSEIIWHKCAACGAKEMVDMSHKLCTYILAQHKKQKKESAKADKGKKEKSKAKGKDKDSVSESKSSKDKDKKKKDKKDDKDKKKKKKKDKEKEKSKDKSGSGDDDDDDKSSEEEAVAGVDDAGAMDLAVAATRTFLAENPDASVEEIVDTVVNQQMASALKSFDKIHIIVKAVITEKFFTDNEIEKYAPIISNIINDNAIMERHLISALEGLCISEPKHFPVMMKQFYDEDVLEEDNILEWAGEGRTEFTLDGVDEETRAVLRAEAEPVVTWLQEADSDSDDE
mmetsp:Transcript_29419/g.43193  ORF Transcript_29419/g.43193 Transcript_29419/m.43193 type:complete len:401 (-) Transcript_29419:2016-3218(-)|eukprot:CAMPEP_0116030806 /NCGR_PEP_ID=MMETSP0321-20121206/17094_1 /TAXON_ID=163516 /ORGANISM="Leptocylindrus danicus var. danicus, Strain B650" /LENGTH=400 /DNA_ID=CAMNT_0003505723 /DNA_START=127 /DNA_END=1329 /DNA_ORIENTATION=-